MFEYLFNVTLTGATTPGQSEHVNNGKKAMILYFS